MAVSIRTSILMAAAALVLLALRAFADTPGDDASDSALCNTGREQSPVDLSASIAAIAPALTPHWRPSSGAMVENIGSGLAVHLTGAGGVSLDGRNYTLSQIDIRHPSEHTLDGAAFPLELQFRHDDGDGRHVIVAVLVAEGASNPSLERILATAPGRPGKAAVSFALNAGELARLSSGHWRYQGSLTSPPCSETATWVVAIQPMTASRGQIAALRAAFPDNARATQPLNRRYVLKSP